MTIQGEALVVLTALLRGGTVDRVTVSHDGAGAWFLVNDEPDWRGPFRNNLVVREA